jgi:hypothetical protein
VEGADEATEVGPHSSTLPATTGFVTVPLVLSLDLAHLRVIASLQRGGEEDVMRKKVRIG